jgi:hypothetical protein
VERVFNQFFNALENFLTYFATVSIRISRCRAEEKDRHRGVYGGNG